MDSRRSWSAGGVSRRELLRVGFAGGAGLALGGGSWWGDARASDGAAPWLEATIPELQALMASGHLSSRELTIQYLRRIWSLNPLLGAVIEINPASISIAARLDNERRMGHLRGPLHGIPILVKDNIASDDHMQTTAGSLALVRSRVPGDSAVVSKLRDAGAVLLGKANLSEWANFRGFAPFSGWSARGGFTRNPYLLDFTPCGSSSGSAVAAAVNLCAGAVGTETDGSICCPAGNNLVVGLKPTVGLISQEGIIPIAATQDSAGPMTRTVTDAAIMLNVLRSPFGEVVDRDPTLPPDYTQVLRRGALDGARIGVDVRYFSFDYGGEPDLIPLVFEALDVMQGLGATIVEVDTGDSFDYFDDEITSLLFEFKVQIADYLATLSRTSLRTLADLIAFNRANCPREMEYFGQEIFELAESTSGDLADPVYVSARQRSRQLARDGIDGTLDAHDLDVIIAPSYSFASSVSACAGYPILSVPIGIAPNGWPAGMWMYGGFLSEPTLLAIAYDLEQAIRPRSSAGFLGSIPPEPPDAGICDGLSGGTSRRLSRQGPTAWRHLGTNKPIIRTP